MKDHLTPNLSVIVPFFNRRKYLRETLLSIFAEGIREMEIIAVDDGSTDRSFETVRDLEIRFLRLERNQGAPLALNEGLRLARGNFIAFADSDDLIVRGGISGRLKFLQTNPSSRAVTGTVLGCINEMGKPMNHHPPVALPPLITRSYFEGGGQITLPLITTMFRRDYCLEIGNFSPQTLVYDLDYYYRAIQRAPIHYSGEPVCLYRMHGTNLTIERSGFLSAKAKAHTLLINMKYQMGPRL